MEMLSNFTPILTFWPNGIQSIQPDPLQEWSLFCFTSSPISMSYSPTCTTLPFISASLMLMGLRFS